LSEKISLVIDCVKTTQVVLSRKGASEKMAWWIFKRLCT